MSYINFNPNPDRKLVGDCVIRAISKAMNQSWEDTYKGRPIKPFVYKEKIFYSYEEFRKEYPNITFTSLKNWIANGKDSEGEKCCRYENALKKGNHSHGNSIEVNGIVYPSVNLASAKLNISRRSLDRYAKGLVKNKNFICKYI